MGFGSANDTPNQKSKRAIEQALSEVFFLLTIMYTTEKESSLLFYFALLDTSVGQVQKVWELRYSARTELLLLHSFFFSLYHDLRLRLNK